MRRQRREEQNKVALVGYTNAGKSSLMRALTGSGVAVADRLFATLDTTVRALQPETRPRVLVSDTVGFIKKLPHELVASFRSTLDEARDAELLLHVVDAADAAFPAQIEVTRAVLDDIGAQGPRLLLLNKIDRVDAARREALRDEYPDALLLSAKDPEDVARLHDRIRDFFERDMVEAELTIPYAQAEARRGDPRELPRALRGPRRARDARAAARAARGARAPAGGGLSSGAASDAVAAASEAASARAPEAACPHRPPCPGCPRWGEPGIDPGVASRLAELAHEAGLAPPRVISGARLGYRHRARLAVRGRANSPKLGIFQEGSHRIVDIPRCRVHHPVINRVAAAVRRALRETATPPYAERPHRGALRSVQIVVERASQRAQVVLVGNASEPAPLEPLARALEPLLGNDLHSLWWNGNPERTNVILGPHWQRLSGPEAVCERIGGVDVFFPPAAFGQNHLELADELVAQIHAWVGDDRRVLELYAGCGPIGLGLLARSR